MLEPAPISNPFAGLRLRELFLWYVVTGVTLLAAVRLVWGHEWVDPRQKGFALVALWSYTVPLVWALLSFRKLGISARRLIGGRPDRYGVIEALLLAFPQLIFSGAGFVAVLYALSFVAPRFVERQLEHPEQLGPQTGQAPVLLVALTFVLIAPIVEEFLFRGVLFNRLASRWGVRRAAVVTALAFGIGHVNVPGMFVFGLILAVLYLKFRTLLVPIACHMINNLVPTLFAIRHFGRETPPLFGGLVRFRTGAVSSLLWAGVFGAILVRYLWRNWPRRDAVLPYFDPARPSELEAASSADPAT